MVRLVFYCKEHGITCCLTNQSEQPELHRLTGLGISSIADAIVAVQLVEQDDTVRRRLLVVKSRGMSHSSQFHWLELSDHGISLSSTAAETAELPAGRPTPRGSRS
jgi:circadian clock protein KaiC